MTAPENRPMVFAGGLMVVAVIVAAIMLAIGLKYLHARPGPQWAQVDPADQQWFHDQVIPGSSNRCCDIADGARAEETLCPGSTYVKCEPGDVSIWVRFHISAAEYSDDDDGSFYPAVERDIDWMRVPDKAILKTSHRSGVPIVWWALSEGYNGPPIIRCFAPGARS